ncbi:hypothetical protein BX600DRAFT_443511 [Xylariales sp. PMI_506]|nr:hypothetical protein BX600DRAFT_443511 [Xylariales sp. PMI_506]
MEANETRGISPGGIRMGRDPVSAGLCTPLGDLASQLWPSTPPARRSNRPAIGQHRWKCDAWNTVPQATHPLGHRIRDWHGRDSSNCITPGYEAYLDSCDRRSALAPPRRQSLFQSIFLQVSEILRKMKNSKLPASSSSDDGLDAATEDPFGPRRQPPPGYTNRPPRQSVPSVAGYSEPSSSNSVYTPSTLLSEAERSSGIRWGDIENHPLLRDTSPPPLREPSPPPTYSLNDENVDSAGGQQRFKPVVDSDIERSSSSLDIDEADLNESRALLEDDQRYKDNINRRRRIKKNHCILAIVAMILFILGLTLGSRLWRRFFRGVTSDCRIGPFTSRAYQLDNINHFDFSKSKVRNSGLPEGFSGTLNIMTGPSYQKSDVNVSIRSTKYDLQDHSRNSEGEWRPTRLSPCAEVTLYFRPGLQLSSLRIDASQLKITLSSDIATIDTTRITLKSGTIEANYFDSSRKTYIDAGLTSISGVFTLHDELSIKVTAGSIAVGVAPEASLQGPSSPAVLDIDSASGRLEIDYPSERGLDYIPDREYRTSIKSRSGIVSGRILHGKETKINVQSGTLVVGIIPYGPSIGSGSTSSSLTTTIQSGYSLLQVHDPYVRNGNDPFKGMSSSHSQTSGRLNLRYPDAWEGSISGHTKSGSIALYGHGVAISEEGRSGGHQFIRAQKGQGENQIKFDIQSGSADVKIGSY